MKKWVRMMAAVHTTAQITNVTVGPYVFEDPAFGEMVDPTDKFPVTAVLIFPRSSTLQHEKIGENTAVPTTAPIFPQACNHSQRTGFKERTLYGRRSTSYMTKECKQNTYS